MFTLKIKTWGAAFQDDCSNHEVRRLLTYVAGLLDAGITSGVLMDTNGNKVGEWRYD